MPAPPLPAVGERIELPEGSTLTVENVYAQHEVGSSEPEEGNVYLCVEVCVEADLRIDDSEDVPFSAPSFTVEDTDAHVYRPALEKRREISETEVLEEVRAILFFEVPEDAGGFVLIYDPPATLAKYLIDLETGLVSFNGTIGEATGSFKYPVGWHVVQTGLKGVMVAAHDYQSYILVYGESRPDLCDPYEYEAYRKSRLEEIEQDPDEELLDTDRLLDWAIFERKSTRHSDSPQLILEAAGCQGDYAFQLWWARFIEETGATPSSAFQAAIRLRDQYFEEVVRSLTVSG